MEDAGIELRQTLIWNKSSFTIGRQDYQWKHEPCLYGWMPGEAHYFSPDRSLATVIEEDRLKDMTRGQLESEIRRLNRLIGKPVDVLDEEKPQKNPDHPTMKPIRLIGEMIANSSKKGWLCLDLFGGSGSTMMACEQLGRRCDMMELDPRFVDVIIRRWEALTGQKARKI